MVELQGRTDKVYENNDHLNGPGLMGQYGLDETMQNKYFQWMLMLKYFLD